MDRYARGKAEGAVSLVAVDVIGRIFGCGRQRRSRLRSRHLGGEGYSRLQDRSCHNTDNGDKLYDSAYDEEDELTVSQRQRQRSSFSSDDSSKRWTSSTDQHGPRRRKGYHCMRLRIVNVMRIVAMIRKVRLACQRMTRAAAASKTILSLGDLYSNIADLIPVPCSGNNDAHTIVVMRPVKCEPDPALDDEGDERPGLSSAQGITAGPSSTIGRSLHHHHHQRQALRPHVVHDAVSRSGAAEAVAGHTPSSSWCKFVLRTFSCVSSVGVVSCTSPGYTRDPS